MQRLVAVSLLASAFMIPAVAEAQDAKKKSTASAQEGKKKAAANGKVEQEKSEEKSTNRAPTIENPILFLIRNSKIQDDLQLRDDQKKTIRSLLDDLDGPLWLLRDTNAETGGDKVQAIIAKARSGLNGILNPSQLKRLDQIVLQAQGPEAILLPGVAQKLVLTNDQKQQVRETVESRRKELQELAKQVAAGKEKEPQEKAAKISATEHEQLLLILTEGQKKQWSAMLGKGIDLGNVQLSNIKAPELAPTDEWINSEPLSLAVLRGRVVALHFWTFG